MRTSSRARSPLLPLTAAVVALSCAPPHIPPTIDTRASSPCLIADTTAPTPDTIRAIGTISHVPSGIDCELQPFRSAVTQAVVALVPPNGVDLREVLEGRFQQTGIPQPDVVVSGDPDLLDFARRRPGYLIQPLPWNTTYVLVTAGGDSIASLPPDEQREALARDAITAETRGAMGPFAWLSAPGCTNRIPIPSSPPRSIVAYPASDAIARQLAERIVSLSAARPRPAWLPTVLARSATTGTRIAPVPSDSITNVLTTGRVAVAIIPVARDQSTTCSTRDNLPLPRGAIPLVDARDHIIIRRGSGAAVIIGANGALHFVKRGER